MGIRQNQSIERLHKAILSGYRSKFDLSQMVQFGLDKNRAEIADGSNLNDIAFNVIMWAKQYGCMDELVKSAYEGNKGYPKLRTYAEDYFGESSVD
ncbi:MAG: effector-associated domain EAD1-containing protein [Chloroflexota bacterium]